MRLFSKITKKFHGASISFPRVSFPFAFAASLFLHLLILVIIGFLIALFTHPTESFLPKRLEFAFVPQETESQTTAIQENVDSRARKSTAASSAPDFPFLSEAQELATPPQPSQRLNLQDRIYPRHFVHSTNQVPLTSARHGPAMVESSANPRDRDISPKAPLLRSTFAYSPRYRHSISSKNFLDKNYRLAPATLEIPQRQRLKLQKKIRKLVKTFQRHHLKDSTFTWQDHNQTFHAKIHHKPAPSADQFDEMVIEVTTKDGGKTLSTQMRMRRLAFSHFAQFVDYWDPMVAIHDDDFNGRFHTNSDFRISSKKGVHPRFRGKVTTTGYQIQPSENFFNVNPDSVFLAGIEMGVDLIHFPRHLNEWIEQYAGVDSMAKVFKKEAWITFYRDGSFAWHSLSSTDEPARLRLPPQPFILIGRDILHVKGVVRGKVLVYSRRKIVIDNDLTYAHHPALSANASDYLGLVSEKDIEIAHPRITGPGDLHIQAAILAKRYFRVPNLYGHGHATLYIYGSLTAGSLTATEPRYATRVYFDKRLEQRRPPHFPMTDKYEMLHWDGRWNLKSTE